MDNKKLIEFKICLEQGTFDGKYIYENFIPEIWFNPSKIYIANKTKGEKPFRSRYLNFLKHESTNLSFVLSNESERFSCKEPAHSKTHQSITIICLYENIEKVFNIINIHCLQNNSFIIGYACSEDDFFRQTTQIPSHYEIRGVKLPEDISLYTDKAGWEKIDISNNPGRINLVSNMWLMSCWRMWFGKPFYNHVDEKVLSSFTEGYVCEKIDNEVFFIQLYKDPFKVDLPENRLIQEKFRQHIDMDKLVNELK